VAILRRPAWYQWAVSTAALVALLVGAGCSTTSPTRRTSPQPSFSTSGSPRPCEACPPAPPSSPSPSALILNLS
jgi:hypothetical protein